MSLYTWKREFYPKPARDVPVKDAVQHSLVKWIGLRPDNLARHGLCRDEDGFTIIEPDDKENKLDISAASCALCVHFLKDEDEEDGDDCRLCPLAIARGGVHCDEAAMWYADPESISPRLTAEEYALLSAEKYSPYRRFTAYGDPEPMIFWLKKAKEL